MRALSLITLVILSAITPAQAVPTASKEIGRDHCPRAIAKILLDIQDQLFYQAWVASKKTSLGDDFEPEKYLLGQLSQIDNMVACESIGFAIQRSIYEHPDADEQTIVANTSLEDAIAYQLMRIVSTDIYGETALTHAAASQEGKGFETTGELLRKILSSFQAAVDQRLGKAKLVYKDAQIHDLEAPGLRAGYEKILHRLKQIIARDGIVTVYFNFISPADPQKLGTVRHSIFAEFQAAHFYLFDMNAPKWVVTWGNGDGSYPDAESLLRNALDYIGAAYLQPNVGNRQTALQLAIYSN